MDSNNPYTGKRITLISNSGIRYEGTLVSVNPDDATVGLSKVRIFGTEDRPAPNFVPPSNSLFESVLFRGTDIREIALINEEPAPFVDPAVLEIHQPSAPQPQAAAAAFPPPSVFPSQSASAAPQRESSGAQSGAAVSHFASAASPRGAQPSFGNQSHSGAPERERDRDRDADRFPHRQANASQRPPFANSTNTALAPGARHEASKPASAKPQSAQAPKPSTWAGVVTSAPPAKAQHGSTSSSNSQNEPESARQRPNRDDQRGKPRSAAPQDQRGAGVSASGDYSQRGGRSTFFDRDSNYQSRDRDRPAYAYAPRGGSAGWARGGGVDRDEAGTRRQTGLVGRGGASEYAPQSGNQRTPFGFGFNAGQQAARGGNAGAFGGYGHQRDREAGGYTGGSARGGRGGTWTRGGREGGRTEWRGQGPRSGGERRAGGVPAEYQEEFDFESGNTQLAHELEKLQLDGTKDGENPKVNAKDAEDAEEGNASGSEDGDESSTHGSESHYDKRKSFFDSISSEVSATNKKPNWQKERQVNAETFGQAALRRGGGGGGRGGRGRGGSWRGPRRGGYGFNSY